MAAIPGNETSLVEHLFVSNRNRWLLYVALFILAIMVRLACFTGFFLSDDLWYSYYSQLIAKGLLGPATTHHGLRVGLTVPVGIIYRLLGVSEWTTILVPLLASSLTVPLLVAVGVRIVSMRAALLAGLLLMTLPVHVTYATILVPEPVMELYVLFGVLLYLKACERGDGTTLAALAGLCFGVAYLAKEVGLFVGGAFFLYSIVRGRWKMALAIAGGMAVVGALETAYYFVQTGDPLYRSHVVAQGQEAYFAATGGVGPLEWRLFKAYPRMMLVPRQEFAFHSLIAVLLAVASLFLVRGEKVWMLLLWATVPMLYLNFGSSSLASYQPVAVAERYISLIYYPLFLLAGAVFCLWLSMPRWASYAAWSIVVLLSVAGVALTVSSQPTFRVERTLVRAILNYAPLLLLAGTVYQRWRSPLRWPRDAAWSIVVLLCVAGFAGGLASRNMLTFSSEAMALRTILERANARSLQIVRFEGARADYWRFATEILSGRDMSVAECSQKCLVISPDALELPVGTQVPEARPEQRLWPERAYRR